MKKIFAILVAAAFAGTIYTAQAAACPGHEKTTVTKKEKKETEEQAKEKAKETDKEKAKAPKAPTTKKVS